MMQIIAYLSTTTDINVMSHLCYPQKFVNTKARLCCKIGVPTLQFTGYSDTNPNLNPDSNASPSSPNSNPCFNTDPNPDLNPNRSTMYANDRDEGISVEYHTGSKYCRAQNKLLLDFWS